MPGAYTDDGSAEGAAALDELPWFARMPREDISLSDYMERMLLEGERMRRVSTITSSEIRCGEFQGSRDKEVAMRAVGVLMLSCNMERCGW